jgi:aspartate/methionine/tyrosine aminotransferase
VINKTKSHKVLVIFNFPNNPSGYTPTEIEAEEIKKIISKHADSGKKILILVDDAYYGLGYENDLVKGSIFSKFVGLHKNVASVKVDGFTKEYYVWGFRIGFLTFSDFNRDKNAFEVLEKKAAATIRSSISNCSMPVQSMFIKFLAGNEYLADKKEKFEILKARALKTKELVYDKKYSDCWSVYPFNSGYFMCLKTKDVNANLLREHILKNYGVGTIALGDTDLRVAFSSVELENLTELFEIIARGIRELKK